MLLGTAQIDITPSPGVELSGFAARIQPSVGVLDPLFAKALYLSQGTERLLWIHCDLVGFERGFVQSFRSWAKEAMGLEKHRVLLSATHTHSGPCTIRLNEAGNYDARYVDQLGDRLRQVALAAQAAPEDCSWCAAEGSLTLAVDRRKTASAHTDPRVAAIGLRRQTGEFAAVIANYPIHPVALGATNRHISADIPGQAAKSLARLLPGEPIVLMTNGASANLNPPAEDVSFVQVRQWGKQIAEAIAPGLKAAAPADGTLRVASRVIELPAEILTVEGVNTAADEALANGWGLARWGGKFRRAVESWRNSLVAQIQAGEVNRHREAELFLVCFGELALLGANAEVFSEFTDWLRKTSRRRIYFVGYANGEIGYLPTQAAYAEGGYEVDVAHFFYGGFRTKAGGLELLAQEASDLLASVPV